jgi:hypothetical protein
VQLETLERVYLRSKRPTVTSISIKITNTTWIAGIFYLLLQRRIIFFIACHAEYNDQQHSSSDKPSTKDHC